MGVIIFSKKINDLNSKHYIITFGMASQLRYGIIKINKNDDFVFLLVVIEL